MSVKVSPSHESIIDLVTTIYDESQLLEIVKDDISLDELNTKYPVECLRNTSSTYRATFLGEGRVAILWFDDSGNRISGNIYTLQRYKGDFDRLDNGQSLEHVREIDPNGEYLFLYTGRNDAPKVSSHYTEDGYLITIEYDDSNTIISISEELI